MPVQDITNPDIIKFLVESYDKTAKLRMRWNNLNKDKLAYTATLQREEKGYYIGDVLKSAMAAEMPSLAADHISGSRNKKKVPIRDGVHIPALADMVKGHSLVDVGLGDVTQDPRLGRPDTDLTIDPIMRPIDPKHKKIVYKDIPYFGRKVYLKERDKIIPEKKYYFRQSEGSVYGWRLKDSFFGNNAPKYGRVWLLTHGTVSRSGPRPDPDHYKSAEIAGANKCIKN